MVYILFLIGMSKTNTLEGQISVHAKGFGFLRQEDKDDIYIPEGKTGLALSGDTVEITVSKDNKGRFEGEVIKLIKRQKTEFVGTIEKSGLSAQAGRPQQGHSPCMKEQPAPQAPVLPATPLQMLFYPLKRPPPAYEACFVRK